MRTLLLFQLARPRFCFMFLFSWLPVVFLHVSPFCARLRPFALFLFLSFSSPHTNLNRTPDQVNTPYPTRYPTLNPTPNQQVPPLLQYYKVPARFPLDYRVVRILTLTLIPSLSLSLIGGCAWTAEFNEFNDGPFGWLCRH